MTTATSITWLTARSSGAVAWGLVVTSMVWGLLLAVRVRPFGRSTPAALLSLHRFLGALAVVFTAVHVTAVVVDDFVHFSVLDALVPLSSEWRPIPVAVGIVAMYLLVAIEATSLLRARLSPRWWREVHLLSYWLFALVTIHALTAGTDVRAVIAESAGFAIGAVGAFFGLGLWWRRSSARVPGA
jgi:DMSO/TMAO reductase YedYZ heme-binding membrane subunit